MHKAMRQAATASAQPYGLGNSQPTRATKLGNNARKNSMAHKWASMVRPSSLRVGDGQGDCCVRLRALLWTRFVGAAAASVHSLLVRAVPRWPLRRRSYGATISLRRRLPLGAKCAPRWPRRSPRQAAGLTTPGVADLHQWEQMGQGQLLCPRAAAAFQQSHRGVTVVVGARGAHHSGPQNFAQY